MIELAPLHVVAAGRPEADLLVVGCFEGEAPANLAIPGALRLRRQGREILATVDGFTEELVAKLARETGAQVEAQAVGLEELFIDLVGEPEGVIRAA